MSENNENEAKKPRPQSVLMSKQEENWRLMTVLQIPWHHANRIETEEDRKFLLEKATEVEGFMQQQQEMQQQQMQQQMEQQGAPDAGGSMPSPILSPDGVSADMVK
tara:strand:- start:887 stop:1204 length:318 start_codon:yes stop_codon:yes gene_type:complete